MPKNRNHKTHILTIATKPTPENLSQCNPQTASPLFSVLPPEIRNYIFSIALTPYEDLSNPYPENDFCYRPGHRAKLLLSTALLLTCRRIWLEANHWPMEQTVHTFWYDESRRPPWQQQSAVSRLHRLNQSLTPTQQAALKHVQVFAQMYWLEGNIPRSSLLDSVENLYWDLDTFTITVRHSDWWFWESDEALRLEVGWVRGLLGSRKVRGVREVRLELETLEGKMGQLRPILAELEGLMGEGERFECVLPHEEWTWSGPTDLGGVEHRVHRGFERLDYRVVVVKWRQCLQRRTGDAADGLRVQTGRGEQGKGGAEGNPNDTNASFKIGRGNCPFPSSSSTQPTSSHQKTNDHHSTPNGNITTTTFKKRTRPLRSCRYPNEHTLLTTIPSTLGWEIYHDYRLRQEQWQLLSSRRNRTAKKARARHGLPRQTLYGNPAREKYNEQMLLLQYQNKRRLEIARAEQVEATGGVDDGWKGWRDRFRPSLIPRGDERFLS